MSPILGPALGLVLLILLTTLMKKGLAIGCFSCSSWNESDPDCRDPFSPLIGVYKPHCRQGKDGRVGVFPAHYCMKMNGISLTRGIEVIVRSCTLENMHEQCGIFELEGERFRGCISTCTKEACNSAPTLQKFTWTHVLGVVISARYFWSQTLC